MLTQKQLVQKMMSNPVVRAAYDAQSEEFAHLEEVLSARQRAGLTQAEVVEKMKLKNSTKGRPRI
jgi:hypothetical protein